MAARKQAAGPPQSVWWAIVLAAVAGATFAIYKGYPGVAVLWVGMVAVALVEPRPVLTGPKDSREAPTPAGAKEIRDQARYEFLRDLGKRSFLHAGSFPGWPMRATFFAALAVGVLATAIPTPIDDRLAWANGAAAFLIVSGIATSLRFTRSPSDPAPPMTFATLGQVASLRPLIIGAGIASIVLGYLSASMLPGIAARLAPDLIPALPWPIYSVAITFLVFLAITASPWRTATRAQWERVVEARAVWDRRWMTALGTSKAAREAGNPRLVAVREIGPLLIETFIAPEGMGAAGVMGLAPKVVPTLPGQTSLAFLPLPDVDPKDGSPVPGTISATRFETVTFAGADQPDLLGPDVDAETVRYLLQYGIEAAAAAYGSGGSGYIVVDVEPMHEVTAPPPEVTGWRRLWSGDGEQAASEIDLDESGVPREVAADEPSDHDDEGEDRRTPGAWRFTVAGNLLKYVRASFKDGMEGALNAPVLVNDRPGDYQPMPGGGYGYVGGLVGYGTAFTDPGAEEMLERIAEDDEWKTRWGFSLKSDVNVPEPRFERKATSTVTSDSPRRDQIEVHSLPFAILAGQTVEEFLGLESKMATNLSSAPFVSISGFPAGAKARPGERHQQVFTLRWSQQPVPTSASRLQPLAGRAAPMSTGPEWVLSGLVVKAFRQARLAQPEVYGIRALTKPESRNGHLWLVQMRLFGGESLASVRSKVNSLASSLSVPWLRVRATEDPQCVEMVMGNHFHTVTLATPDRDLPLLMDLDWQQAFIDANLRTEAGLTPVLTNAGALSEGSKVTALDFDLPSPLTLERIKGAREKLKGATNNAFVDPRPGVDGPASVRILVCDIDPMPTEAPVDWREVKGNVASPWLVPFGTGVEGSSISLDFKTSPHVLITGAAGSGKSATASMLIGAMLMTGWEVHLADPTKDAADFKWAAPWLSTLAITYEETGAMMDAVYAEVLRRKTLNGKYGATTYLDLPDDVRPGPVCVFLDEFTSLIIQDKPTKPPEDDEEAWAEYQAILARNGLIQRIGAKAGRFVREARSAGVHLVLAAQQLKAKSLDGIPGGETLKDNMSRIVMGKATFGNLQAALKEPTEAPSLGEVIPRGRGLFESNVSGIVVFQGWYDHPMDEAMTQAISAVREPLADHERLDLAPYMPRTSRPKAVGSVVEDDLAVVDPFAGLEDEEVLDLGDMDMPMDLSNLAPPPDDEDEDAQVSTAPPPAPRDEAPVLPPGDESNSEPEIDLTQITFLDEEPVAPTDVEPAPEAPAPGESFSLDFLGEADADTAAEVPEPEPEPVFVAGAEPVIEDVFAPPVVTEPVPAPPTPPAAADQRVWVADGDSLVPAGVTVWWVGPAERAPQGARALALEEDPMMGHPALDAAATALEGSGVTHLIWAVDGFDEDGEFLAVAATRLLSAYGVTVTAAEDVDEAPQPASHPDPASAPTDARVEPSAAGRRSSDWMPSGLEEIF